MKYALWAVFALGLVAAAGSVVVENDYRGRAQLVQRVQRDEGADLFGDAGTPLGSPQLLIIDDPKAFVEGKGDQDSRLVDDKYLSDHNIYPLQMKTVSYFAEMTRLGSGAAILAAVAGLIILRRRRS